MFKNMPFAKGKVERLEKADDEISFIIKSMDDSIIRATFHCEIMADALVGLRERQAVIQAELKYLNRVLAKGEKPFGTPVDWDKR